MKSISLILSVAALALLPSCQTADIADTATLTLFDAQGKEVVRVSKNDLKTAIPGVNYRLRKDASDKVVDGILWVSGVAAKSYISSKFQEGQRPDNGK